MWLLLVVGNNVVCHLLLHYYKNLLYSSWMNQLLAWTRYYGKGYNFSLVECFDSIPWGVILKKWSYGLWL